MSSPHRDPRSILERPLPGGALRLWYGEEALQFGELWLPQGEGPHPVVVNVHGGFWRARYDLVHAGHQCAALAAAGIAAWNLEYRRVGNPGGGWPGTLLDVAAGLDYLEVAAARYPLELARVLVMGHSAGGHLALWLAARHRLPPGAPFPASPIPLRGVISLAGVCDLRWASRRRLSDDGKATDQFIGGTPEELPERYALASPYDLLPLGLPQILIHGSEDQSVPHAISARYVERAASLGDPATLITLPRAGHFELIDPLTPEWQIVQGSIDRLLAG